MTREERQEAKRVMAKANRARMDQFKIDNDIRHGETIAISRDSDGRERLYMSIEERNADSNPYDHVLGSTTAGSSADLWNINNGRPRKVFRGPSAVEILHAQESPFIETYNVETGIVEDEDYSGPDNNVTRETLSDYLTTL